MQFATNLLSYEPTLHWIARCIAYHLDSFLTHKWPFSQGPRVVEWVTASEIFLEAKGKLRFSNTEGGRTLTDFNRTSETIYHI